MDIFLQVADRFPFYVEKALRMILQLGVKRSWFNVSSILDKGQYKVLKTPSSTGDLRNYMINSSPVGDSVVPELLLKVLEPYRKEGWFFTFL